MALKQGGRTSFGGHDTFQRVPKQGIAAAREIAAFVELLVGLCDGGVVLGTSLCLHVSNDVPDLSFIDKCPVHTNHLRASGRKKEHIALTQMALRTITVDDRS